MLFTYIVSQHSRTYIYKSIAYIHKYILILFSFFVYCVLPLVLIFLFSSLLLSFSCPHRKLICFFLLFFPFFQSRFLLLFSVFYFLHPMSSLFFLYSFIQHVLAFSGHALPHIFADVRQINRASASHTCSARNIRLFEQEGIVPFELSSLSLFLYTFRNFLSFFVS